MKALILKKPGDRPQIEIQDVQVPILGPQDVLVKVSACGLCYHDILVMRGILRRGVKPNVILGHEVSGTIEKLGDKVTIFQKGDSVVSLLSQTCGECSRCKDGLEHRCLNGIGIGHGCDGGFAEYIKVSQHSLIKLPKTLDIHTASILACPIGVSYHSLLSADFKVGETVMITGAGGGLGTHLIQMANALGASKTIAVTSSPHKEEQLNKLGATEVIPMTDDIDFSELALALTEEKGVNVIVNTVGSSLFKSCLQALSQFGRIALVGEIDGKPVNLNPAEIIFKDAHLIGVSGVSKIELSKVIELVSGGKIKPTISESFQLDDVMRAYDKMILKNSFGRITLTP